MENNPYQSPNTDSNNVVPEPGIWPQFPKWYKWLAAVVGAAMTFVGVMLVTFLAGAIVVMLVFPSSVSVGDAPEGFRAFPKFILFVIAICVGMVAAIRSVLRTFKLFEES